MPMDPERDRLPPDMDVFDDPEELGRRLRTARNYTGLSHEDFAPLVGKSAPTLYRIEIGEPSSIGRTREKRRLIAELIVRAAGAPEELLGGGAAEGSTEQRLGRLEDRVDRLAQLFEDRLAEVLEDEASEPLQADPIAGPGEAVDRGPRNE